MEQKNELYHYGRKGMKWGKHLFDKDDLENLWQKRITGDYYKSRMLNAKVHGGNNGGIQTDRAMARSIRRDMNNPNRDRRFGNNQMTYDLFRHRAKSSEISNKYNAKKYAKAFNDYRTKSVKGIAESKVIKAKNWISSRPAAAKKKVSDIKEKIAKAESGKKTVTFPLSRDANKKKTKKSTIKSSSHYMSNY